MSWESLDFKLAVKDITGGNRKFQSSEYQIAGIYPIIDQSENFIGGFTDENCVVSRNKDVVVFGDHTKALKYVDFDFCLGADGVKVLEPIEKLDSKFLYYFLQTINLPNVGYSRHFKFLKEIQIPLPPLETQKRIADILDAADALRQKDQELLKKYDELAQAIFIDMFGDPVKNEKGWKIKPLGKVCKLQGGFSFKSTDFVAKGIKLVKIANVNFQKLDWEEVDYLPNSYIQNHSDFALEAGDILMALTRPIIKSLGSVKAVKVQESDLPALLNQRVARFFPDTEIITKEFLLRIIYSHYFKSKIEKYSSTSLQPNVSNKQVESIEVFLPPKALQNNFEKRADLIDEQKANAQKSLDKSEALFNNLLQIAFKGELI